MPAPALARELEVSERTIYRDVEALSAAGVPVYSERGRNGGVALLTGHRTDVVQLSALSVEEARALFAYGGRGGPEDAALRSGLRKLLAALPATQRPEVERASERVVVDPTGWRRPAEDVPALSAVRDAVWADERLRLRYRSADAPRALTCTVDPYGLLAKAGVWYLIAAHRHRPRLYRVSRIEQVLRTGEPADRPPDLDLQALWRRLRADFEESPAAVDVTLVVRADRTAMLLRMVAAQLAGRPRGPGPLRGGRLTAPTGSVSRPRRTVPARNQRAGRTASEAARLDFGKRRRRRIGNCRGARGLAVGPEPSVFLRSPARFVPLRRPWPGRSVSSSRRVEPCTRVPASARIWSTSCRISDGVGSSSRRGCDRFPFHDRRGNCPARLAAAAVRGKTRLRRHTGPSGVRCIDTTDPTRTPTPQGIPTPPARESRHTQTTPTPHDTQVETRHRPATIKAGQSVRCTWESNPEPHGLRAQSWCGSTCVRCRRSTGFEAVAGLRPLARLARRSVDQQVSSRSSVRITCLAWMWT